MKLASAQTSPVRGNIDYNIDQHCFLCEKAIESEANMVVFPELSLSGYEREDAYKYFFTHDDARLIKLKKISVAGKLIIIAGAPVKINTGLYIGSFLIFPDGRTSIYTKQYLHTGEDQYYQSSFDFDPQISLENMKVSLAICADVEHNQHIKTAKNKGSKMYIPSIFYTPGSISKLHDKLSSYAKDYNMNILMSNFCGESYGSDAGGCSAFWNQKGELIGALDSDSSGLLIVENTPNDWMSTIVKA